MDDESLRAKYKERIKDMGFDEIVEKGTKIAKEIAKETRCGYKAMIKERKRALLEATREYNREKTQRNKSFMDSEQKGVHFWMRALRMKGKDGCEKYNCTHII